MDRYRSERVLCTTYCVSFALAVIACICSAVAWNHWRLVLDVCPLDCGCILYGRSVSVFEGGGRSPCLFAVFGPLPVAAFALVMGGYHFVRVCINSEGKYERPKDGGTIVRQREGEIVMIASRVEAKNTDSVVNCWIPAAVMSSIFAAYCIVLAAILTDGFYKTCNQYRGELIKTLRATGNQVTAIHSRLGCQAVFDFMDYLQPDRYDIRRGEAINTGFALQTAIACSWILVCALIFATVMNSLRAHRDKDVITCCGQ